uniref:ADF-H domain-containing protein n=1 Tax=Myotis myotis TaxID=51298 RepID=A0A7J7WW23_MYOMY|nr:hypothetical protein mMyoMyo1_011938 [Myotis myotis]
MASGVAVSDGVIKVFNDMKARKSLTPEEVKKRERAVLFCLSEDKKNIIWKRQGDPGEQEGEPGVYLLGPESAPLKSKMIYASSKDAIENKLTGIKHELQANCYEEVKDHCTLAEKLGAVLSSPWRASLCEPPRAPCLEHLAAIDLPVRGCRPPTSARPEGLEGSQQGEGNPFTQLPNSPSPPGPSFSLHP